MSSTPLVLKAPGFTLTTTNCLCIAPDASRALLAHNAVTHRGVLLCAAGATGEFTRVSFPEGWGAPTACSWSPMGGALGTATSDETCLLAVACGTRVGLCARMATLQACLKAQVPGPANDPAWFPAGLPYSKHWAVLPLDIVEGGVVQHLQKQKQAQELQSKCAQEEGAMGEGEPQTTTTATSATASIPPPQPLPNPTFTALCWSPRLYRNPVGARSYLALGTSLGTLNLVRVSCFNPKLWHPGAPPHPAQGPDSSRGFVECVTVGTSGVVGVEVSSSGGSGGGGGGGGGGVGITAMSWYGGGGAFPPSCLVVGCENGSVHLCPFIPAREATAQASSSSSSISISGGELWDDGVVFLPPRCLLPPNGSPVVALKWLGGVLGLSAGSSLTLLWPESWGLLEGGGGEGGGGVLAVGVAGQGWDVASVRVDMQGAGTKVVEGLQGCTVRNAHGGGITGLHLGCSSSSSSASERGDGRATHAFTTSLDGTVRKWSLATMQAWCANAAAGTSTAVATAASTAALAVKSKKRGSSSSSSTITATTTTNNPSNTSVTVLPLVTQLSTTNPGEGFRPLPRVSAWLPPLYGLAGDDVGLSLITAGAGFGGGGGESGGGMASAISGAAGAGGGGVGGKEDSKASKLAKQMEQNTLSAHSMQLQATESLHVALHSIPLHHAHSFALSHSQDRLGNPSTANMSSAPTHALKQLLQAAAAATGAARAPSTSSSSSSSSSSFSSFTYLPSHTIHEGPGVLCASLYPLPYAKAGKGTTGVAAAAAATASGGGGGVWGAMGAPAVHWDTVSLCQYLDACGKAAVALGRQDRAQGLLEASQLGGGLSSSSSSSSSISGLSEGGEQVGLPVYLPLHKLPPPSQQHKASKPKAKKAMAAAAAAAAAVAVDDMDASAAPLDTTSAAAAAASSAGEEGAKKRRRKKRKVSASRTSSHPPPPLSTTHWATVALPTTAAAGGGGGVGEEEEASHGHFSPFSTRLVFDAAAEGVREGDEGKGREDTPTTISTRIRTVIDTALMSTSSSSSSSFSSSSLLSRQALNWELAYPLLVLQCLANAYDGNEQQHTTRASLHLALHLTRHILSQAHQAARAGVVALTASFATTETGSSSSSSSSFGSGGGNKQYLPTAAISFFSGGSEDGSSSTGGGIGPPHHHQRHLLTRGCHGPHPPRWVWYAAAIAPRLYLWARGVSLVAALDSHASAPACWIPGPHRGAFKRGALWATWALGVRVKTSSGGGGSSIAATKAAGSGSGSGSGAGSAMEGIEGEGEGGEREKKEEREGEGEVEMKKMDEGGEVVAVAAAVSGASPLSPSLLKGLQRVQAALVFTTSEDSNSGSGAAAGSGSGSGSGAGAGFASDKKSGGKDGKGGGKGTSSGSKKRAWEEPIPPHALLSPLTWSHWSMAATPPHAAVIAGALALCKEE